MIHNVMFNSIGSQQTVGAAQADRTPAQATKQFGEYLKNAIDQVEAQEQTVHAMNDKFLLGEVNVDQLMITSEQALLSLQLTSQIRNKVIEAYQEIMRIQL